jgi:hypothetical protein
VHALVTASGNMFSNSLLSVLADYLRVMSLPSQNPPHLELLVISAVCPSGGASTCMHAAGFAAAAAVAPSLSLQMLWLCFREY